MSERSRPSDESILARSLTFSELVQFCFQNVRLVIMSEKKEKSILSFFNKTPNAKSSSRNLPGPSADKKKS